MNNENDMTILTEGTFDFVSDYNWLTLAEYGEGDNLTDHKNRYTENFIEFMRNGGIRRLQRHGLKADGVYGKIDNLHIYYDGNRMYTTD